MGLFGKKDEEDFEYCQVDDDNFEEGTSIDWDNYYDEKNKKHMKKFKKRQLESDTAPFINEPEDFDDILDKKKNNGENQKFNINIKHTIVICIIAFYLIFVGTGYLITTYDSKNTPQVINVGLREERENYYVAKGHFDEITQLISVVDLVDKKVASADNSLYFSYATEYKNILNKYCDQGIRDIQGVDYGDQEVLQKQGYQIYNDIASYLQLISQALTANDDGEFQKALAYRNQYAQEYMQYKNNIQEFAKYVGLKQ